MSKHPIATLFAACFVLLATRAHSQNTPPTPIVAPNLSALPQAIRQADQARRDDMDAHNEVGAGSETFGCMSVITERRLQAVRRLQALAQQSTANPPPAWCTVASEATSLVQELAYAGEQNCALDGTGPGPIYLSTGNIGGVAIPAELTRWLTAVSVRCSSATPTQTPVREHRCTVRAPADFHLRPTPVVDSTGRSIRANAVLQVVERGTLTRQRDTIYRVRVVGMNWEGWVFLPPSLLPANCP